MSLIMVGLGLLIAVPAQAWGPCGPRYGYRGYGYGGGVYIGPRWGPPPWAYDCGPVVRIRLFEARRQVIVVPNRQRVVRNEVVANVQASLNARGFDAGPVDGIPGTRTRDAVAAYQQAQGLPVTGQINNDLLASLERIPVTQQEPEPRDPSLQAPPPNNPPPPTGTKPQSQPKPKYPTAILVPDKDGYVKSPYAEHAGLVDVRGFTAGTMVRCPYTGKIFVVP